MQFKKLHTLCSWQWILRCAVLLYPVDTSDLNLRQFQAPHWYAMGTGHICAIPHSSYVRWHTPSWSFMHIGVYF